jgi:hypothetical protein
MRLLSWPSHRPWFHECYFLSEVQIFWAFRSLTPSVCVPFRRGAKFHTWNTSSKCIVLHVLMFRRREGKTRFWTYW